MSKTNSRSEYYISIDVEANGPCPGLNSMLQLGAAFYSPEGEYLEGLCWNLHPLPDAVADPDTMEWWRKQEVEFPGIWDRLIADRVEPSIAMVQFTAAVTRISRKLKSKPVVVCYPAGFDFTFLYVYLMRFIGSSIIGFSCIDIKTLSMALLNKNYRDHGKKDMPKHWFAAGLPHTHNAQADAMEQGAILQEMLKDLRKLHVNREESARTTYQFLPVNPNPEPKQEE